VLSRGLQHTALNAVYGGQPVTIGQIIYLVRAAIMMTYGWAGEVRFPWMSELLVDSRKIEWKLLYLMH